MTFSDRPWGIVPERPFPTEEERTARMVSALALRDFFTYSSSAYGAHIVNGEFFTTEEMGLVFDPVEVRRWADSIGYFEAESWEQNRPGVVEASGVPAVRFPERPTEVPRLYRAAKPAMRARWAWTHELEIVQTFKGGFQFSDPEFSIDNPETHRKIYTLQPPAEHVLAQIWKSYAWMIDTRGLEHLISEYEAAKEES